MSCPPTSSSLFFLGTFLVASEQFRTLFVGKTCDRVDSFCHRFCSNVMADTLRGISSLQRTVKSESCKEEPYRCDVWVQRSKNGQLVALPSIPKIGKPHFWNTASKLFSDLNSGINIPPLMARRMGSLLDHPQSHGKLLPGSS